MIKVPLASGKFIFRKNTLAFLGRFAMSALKGAYKTTKQAGSMIPVPNVGGELTLRVPKKKGRRKPTGAMSCF